MNCNVVQICVVNRGGVGSRDNSGLNSSARKIEGELWILEVMYGLRKGWMLVKRKNCSKGCFTCENMKEYILKVE